MPVSDNRLHEARIVVLDDEPADAKLVARALESAGYRTVETARDPTRALELCAGDSADLLLLDLRMPGMDGFDVLGRLRELTSDFDHFPVIVVSAEEDREAKKRAFEAGASDYLTKPISPSELRLRVGNHLERRFLHVALKEHGELLEERVRERTAELRAAQIEILEKLALSAEYRDDETGEHTRRVGHLSEGVAEELGISGERLHHIRRAAPLHDIGKIGIPDSILLKPGKLTSEEFRVMKEHTVIGAEILADSQFSVLRLGEKIARWHHERWDGTGYPDGIAGEEIPLEARIVQAVDVFDSLTHDRVYKDAWPVEEGVAYMEDQAGEEFDPDVVDALLSLVRTGDYELVPVRDRGRAGEGEGIAR